jgi:hypothetical protein
MKAHCAHCDIIARPDPIYIWHAKTFTTRTVGGHEVAQTLWLCPDCVAEFEDDEERDQFLESQLPTALTR